MTTSFVHMDQCSERSFHIALRTTWCGEYILPYIPIQMAYMDADNEGK